MPLFEQRRPLYLAIVVILILLVSLIPSQFRDDSPVLVLTGDFDKRDDFGQDVLDGANKAALHRRDATSKFSPRVIKLNTKTTESLDDFRARFLNIHTKHNILAVISADISSTASTVITVANSYNIPVLLTVATSDNVLSARRNDLCFRLVPTDSKQADSLALWCRGKQYPVIIHGAQTPYGRFLGTKLIELTNQEGFPLPLFSSYFDSTEMFSILTPIRNLDVDGIVFIGYSDRFVEFFGKLQAIGWKGPVLLSDGCYSQALIRRPPARELFLSYPTNPVPRGDRYRVQANGVFGWDAYVLLTETFSEMKRTKESFSATFRMLARSESEATKTTYSRCTHSTKAAKTNELSFGYSICKISRIVLPTQDETVSPPNRSDLYSA